MARAPFQVLVIPYRPLGNNVFEYALLKRADKGYWQAVAGGGEDDESVLQAAQRETLEETGIPPDAPFFPLQTVEPIPVTEFKDSHLWGEETYIIPQYCFGVLAPSRELRISHEHLEYEWFAFAEAFKLLKFDGNRTALWELDRRLRGVGPQAEPYLESYPTQSQPLVFLKLGGSLITEKTQTSTARVEVITRLAKEIAEALSDQPNIRLVLGHGSGSFGHIPAKKYGTRQGVHTIEEWQGFMEVWYEASRLNRIVVEALQAVKLPVITFPPSAAVIAHRGQIIKWDIAALEKALEYGLLPVVYGDVAFDERLGGTILSTEDLFDHLAIKLHPSRMLLAGLEEGVWEDYPNYSRLIPEISSQNFPQLESMIGGSAGTDVTGGMESKVRQTLALVEKIPDLQAWIFSGSLPGNVYQALTGASLGTHLCR